MKKTLPVLLVATLLATPVLAQRIDFTIRCGQPDKSYTIPIPDDPGHALTLSHAKCTYTRGGEVAGLTPQAGEDTITAEATGNRNECTGTFIVTFSNGDKLFYRHHGSGTSQGQAFSGTDSWEVVRGTGRLAGYTGRGTCKIRSGADGNYDNPCTGEVKRLNTQGIRARVRHPYYLGHLCELLGWTIGTGLVVLWLLLVFAVITGAFMIRSEERELASRFGEEYRAYQRRVPAILPRF